MDEIWKQVVGEEGLYEVSSLGRVRSLDRQFTKSNNALCIVKGRILKQHTRGGYFLVRTSRGTQSTHRLVASAFLPNPDGYTEVNHKDCNKENNTVDNLEWVSPKQNMRHAVLNNRKVGGGKLSPFRVRLIRSGLRHGFTRKELASIFEVTAYTISEVGTRKTWKCVS